MHVIYRILFEADKHWGAMRVDDQYRSSYIIKRFLADFPIDLYINLGDFFDTKLLLNSKSSIYALRDFTEKAEICRMRGIPVRAIKGTRSHDYDQWDAFDKLYQDPESKVKYFRTCTVEETLPGMRIWYAPEENMNFADYVDEYADILLDGAIHLAALHGNFDKIMPDVAVKSINNDGMSTTLVFRYDELERLVHGPLVAGHWHDGETYEHLSYVGSYDRWTFGEDEQKGFMIVEYDTETETYKQIKVPNLMAGRYKTYEVYTSLYKGQKEYKALIDAVKANLEADTRIQIRILVKINELQADTEEQIDNLKYLFGNERRVKLTIINQVHMELKEKHREENQKLESAYSYIRDKNLSVAEIIQKFIQQFAGHEYTVGEIGDVIKPYLEML
jgi:hypothetical protein